MADPLVNVRAEILEDYPAIADVHLRATGKGYSSELIVAMHRQRPGYDPRLSLIAERGGEVIGHILYSPRVFRLLGEDVSAVNLSPLSVLPLWQGQGVGGALVEAGDAEARRLGHPFSLLVGHDTYYPRFGYRQHVYGGSRWTFPAHSLTPKLIVPPLETRPVAPTDIAALAQLWRAEESRIDLAIVPDSTAAAWYSPDPRVACTVYLSSNKIVGYTRIASHEPGIVRTFLAFDPGIARRIAQQLARDGDLTLPLHPNSGSAAAFADIGAPEFGANKHCMARVFAPSLLDDYLDLLGRGECLAGRLIWPAEFDV